jgi:hypothetical protein
MPYHDPMRPWVNSWFASTEGDMRPAFVAAINEANQDRLEAEGGACIMYTHFGHGFVEDDKIQTRFGGLMRRLSRKNGWFVPVSTLMQHLESQRTVSSVVTAAERASLESRWLRAKIVHGTS